MPTFASWEATVLEHTYGVVDYISLHAYYEQHGDDVASFLATATDMDRFIDAVIATADHVGARVRSTKKLRLAFDEWNVWYQERFVGQGNLDWEYARPLIEDNYSVLDAVVVGSYLISLLNHADRVAIACQAQLVNVIGPIRTANGGPAWRQSIFHPFALTARYATGTVLRTEPVGPSHHTARYGEVPTVDTVAVHDEEAGALAVFAVNRGDADLRLDLDLRCWDGPTGVEQLTLDAGAAPDAVNDMETTDRVVPHTAGRPTVEAGRSSVRLPAASWNLIRYELPHP
jgi:alpha-L-arabinofuranosidase